MAAPRPSPSASPSSRWPCHRQPCPPCGAACSPCWPPRCSASARRWCSSSGPGSARSARQHCCMPGPRPWALLSRQRIEREARLQRSDLPRLLAMAALRRRHRPGGAGLGPAAHQRHQCVADAHAGSPVHRRAGLAPVPRDHGRPRLDGDGAAAGRWHGAGAGPGPGSERRRAAVGPAGRAAGHRRLGCGQHLVACAGRARPRAGGDGQGAARRHAPRRCWRWSSASRCRRRWPRWPCWPSAPPATA